MSRDQREERDWALWVSAGRVFQVEGIESAKAMRCEYA